MCSDISATMTTTNERPFSPKQAAVPKNSAAPASSGPNTRARLNWIELSAIAFGRCFLVDERRHQRLIRGAAEGLRHAGDERQRQDVPDADVAEVDQRRERERRRHLDVLRAEQQAASIVAIGDDAADQREQQDRQLPEKVVEPEEERRLRQIEDQPALRDLLHPGADRGGEGAEPQDAEIAIGERRERALQERLADAGAAVACACGSGWAVDSTGVAKGTPILTANSSAVYAAPARRTLDRRLRLALYSAGEAKKKRNTDVVGTRSRTRIAAPRPQARSSR